MSRRRKKNSKNLIPVILVVGLTLIALGISRVTGMNVLQSVISLVSIVFLLALLKVILSIPAVRGKIGEIRVSRQLDKLKAEHGGYVINDIMVPDDENGRTSQIDHIYISKFGVYVIETKNYSGRIYGNDNQLEWTQVLAFGNSKHKLYNPVKQNKTHIERLKKIVGTDIPLKSAIILIVKGSNFSESDFVYELRDIKKIIDVKDETYDESLLEPIYKSLMEYKENPVISNKEHVEEIKEMLSNIDNNICPRCGGQLVLRKSKDTGREFYGCSNFPNCRFIKK